jgi:outer membrane protein assembly factor BamB
MGDAEQHRGERRYIRRPWAVGLAVGVAVAGRAGARVVVVNGVVQDDDAEQNHSGFVLRKQPAAVTEAIEDFERYRDHKAWEKAFAALAKVADAGGDRLLVTSDGLAIPAAAKVRRELLTLPPDGREAYRLFNDAKAQQLFKQATAASDDPAAAPVDDVPALRKIVDQYFVTTVGDQAADRLGDALFEAGDFTGAEAQWRSVVDDFPDTTLPAALLQAKRATALATAGQWSAYEAVRATVHDRYAGQLVHIGGRDVDATAYVDGLSAHRHEPPTPAAPTPAAVADAPLAMPTSDVPLWQFPLMDAAASKAIEDRLVGFGWGRLAGTLLAAVPPVAVDDKRAYVNWFGCCLALDLNSGKLLWRTVSPAAVAQGLTAGAMQGNIAQPSGYGVIVAGDRVLFVGHSPPTANGNDNSAGSSMVCLSADAGKRLWATSVGPLQQWSIAGPPLVVGDGLYVIAADGQKQEYSLISMALSDGAVRSKVALGTPQFPTDQFRGQAVPRPPALLARGDQVFVLTNDGAVLAVNPTGGRLEWGYTYPTKAESSENYYYNYAVPPPALSPGAMLAVGDTLYVKEFGTTQLYALDLTGPSVKWRRPVDADSGMVSVSPDGNLYMIGASADAISTDDKRMLWSDKLSIATGEVRPLLAGGHLYAFGKRGVHDVVLADGSEPNPPFRGADRDSAGGLVLRAGGRLLITVSNAAVTAYPLGGTPTTPLAPAAGGH